VQVLLKGRPWVLYNVVFFLALRQVLLAVGGRWEDTHGHLAFAGAVADDFERWVRVVEVEEEVLEGEVGLADELVLFGVPEGVVVFVGESGVFGVLDVFLEHVFGEVQAVLEGLDCPEVDPALLQVLYHYAQADAAFVGGVFQDLSKLVVSEILVIDLCRDFDLSFHLFSY
jgi:hypothetical protein